MSTTPLLSGVADYYAAKLAEHGESARGVDWNGEASQATRFTQLCRVIDDRQAFSLNDLGCGYGALVDHLRLRHPTFDYRGYDVAQPMIETARARFGETDRQRFIVASAPDREANFGIASGIFNVRLRVGDEEWSAYIEATLDALNISSRSGFAFNCLTSYSDADKKRDYLYYANPLEWFDLCKRKFSRQVALLHDYGLYEFTILVRKDSA